MYTSSKWWLVNELRPVAQVIYSFFFFFHLGIIVMFVLGFYSGLSGKVRTVYLFSLYVASLLSSRFPASALVWFSNFLKYLALHFFYFTELCVHLEIFMHPVVVYVPRCIRNRTESLGLEALEDSMLELEAVPHS
jgi:hypothetical protein